MSVRADMPSHVASLRPRRGGGWMVTLADLMALMLTFFVLMFSMQRIDSGKWESVRDAIEREFPGKASKPAALPPRDAPSTAGLDPQAGRDAGYLAGVLSRNLSDSIPGIRIVHTETAIVTTLPEAAVDTLAGGAPQAQQALSLLAEQLRRIGRDIVVQGVAPGSGAVPVAAERWRASLSRADMLAEGLRNAGFSAGMDVGAVGEAGDTERGGLRVRIELGAAEIAS